MTMSSGFTTEYDINSAYPFIASKKTAFQVLHNNSIYGKKAVNLILDFFEDAYTRWAEGLCPCCGHTWQYGNYKAIGEGVMICGTCVRDKHDEPAEFREGLLLSILNGAMHAQAQR